MCVCLCVSICVCVRVNCVYTGMSGVWLGLSVYCVCARKVGVLVSTMRIMIRKVAVHALHIKQCWLCLSSLETVWLMHALHVKQCWLCPSSLETVWVCEVNASPATPNLPHRSRSSNKRNELSSSSRFCDPAQIAPPAL